VIAALHANNANRAALPGCQQVHCARLCGVGEAVLERAAAVIALLEAGQPIPRLGTPELAARWRGAAARRLVLGCCLLLEL